MNQLFPMAHPERKYRRLLDTSMLLNSATSLDDLLNYIIEAVTELLDCQGGAVLLFDEVSASLRFVASTGSDHEELKHIPVPLNDSVAGKVYVFGDPVVDNDTRSSGQHFEEVGSQVAVETRSLLAVPLNVEGTTIGVLEAINKRSGVFGTEDEATLGMFAIQAALAIRNERQNDRVRTALTRLREFEEFRSEFLAIASHELRTPLSIISQSLEILEMESEEELSAFAADARVAADRLTAIVNSMGQLETLRLASRTVEQEAVDLTSVVEGLIKKQQALVGRSGFMVKWTPPKVPCVIRSGGLRVEQVIDNGFSNALNAVSNHGKVDIEILVTGYHAEVRIQDNGPGLPKDELEKVFGEFYQVENHLTRTGQGLGIGLTVARKLARMDGGDVWLSSDGYGTGTTFHARFPLV